MTCELGTNRTATSQLAPAVFVPSSHTDKKAAVSASCETKDLLIAAQAHIVICSLVLLAIHLIVRYHDEVFAAVE